MRHILQWRFLIHLWTLSGLGFAMLALQAIYVGDFDSAARWLLFVLFVDHSDGTLARTFKVAKHIERVNGATLDLVTDVIGMTFVPIFFCWKAGVFLPGWGAALSVGAIMTCSFKYAQKQTVLEDGYSLGAPPVFLTTMLFWLLGAPQVWATAFVIVLIVLCWSPVRYPITSLVTTHWKPGFASFINYASILSLAPTMILLQDGPAALYLGLLALMVFHLVVAPILLQVGIVRSGFRRVY